MNKEKRYVKDLKFYIATVTVGTMLASFITFGLIAFFIANFILKESLTYEVLITLCILVCILSILLSSYLICIGTGHLTKPLLEITEVAKQVANGNFSVRVRRKDKKYEGYDYNNQLDELAINMNKMVEELEGMDYMRKDFMSNVSHEIKTPIAAINGFSELLLDGNLPEEKQREYLKIINNESMRVSRLCEYMLNMSRLDNQVIVVNKNEVKLDEQIRKCIILLCEKYNNLDIDFDIDLKPIIIKSDTDMLQQIWLNIIENSIKYSKKDCKIIITSKEIENNLIEVKIIDNGIGIPKNKINKIFDKFYQCEESHKKSGTGLGLAITKRIIELLNGRIKYYSTEGVGTTVKITLPKYL